MIGISPGCSSHELPDADAGALLRDDGDIPPDAKDIAIRRRGDGKVRLAGGSDEEVDIESRPASRARSVVHADEPSSSLPKATPERPSTEPLDAQIEQIDLDLSVMVSEEPTVWQFDRLRADAEELGEDLLLGERGNRDQAGERGQEEESLCEGHLGLESERRPDDSCSHYCGQQ